MLGMKKSGSGKLRNLGYVMKLKEGGNMSILLKNGRVITPFDARDEDIGVMSDKIVDIGKELIERNYAEKIDCRGKFIIPGLIDIHVHGCKGFSVMDGKTVEMSLFLANHGVTSFLPTTIASSFGDLKRVGEEVSYAIKGGKCISHILGLNLEGPWISREKAGSQPKQFIGKASIEEFDEINVENIVKIITLAPEENMEIIEGLFKRGVTVSLGHSNADYETAKKAIAMGAKLSTHTFNAMRSFHHRDPGIVGAVLESEKIYCEVIPDLIHVHGSVLKILIKVKGVDKVILITDGTEAVGLEDGEYDMSLGRVNIRKGACRLANGTLAGSTLTLDQGIRNLISLGISLRDAVKMATINPATLLSVEDRKGSIAIGKDADVVILNKNLEVDRVIIEGKMISQNE
jgi:N-acetylglucosamine-6-phosphate deacetylase